MNKNLIKILSFFVGLFITLAILSYYKINESFTDAPPNQDENKKEKKDPVIEPIVITEDQSSLPLEGYKFMCINTYTDTNKISSKDGKWFDNNSENKHYDINYNNYFKFNNGVELRDNNLNKYGAKMASIKNIQLDGPSCFNFANNSETYELTEFSLFIVSKITKFSSNHNILFEMTGNTVTTNNITPNYTSSIINVDFIVNEQSNYNINIRVGDKVYSGLIDNIDKDIIHDPYYITFGFYYTPTKVSFAINKKTYDYDNINPFKITLGSTPFIINKFGSIDMELFNFVYYKSLFEYFDQFVRYNNYYIAGVYYETINKKCENSCKKEEEIKPKDIIELPEFKYDLMDEIKQPLSILDRIFNTFI